MSAIVAGTGQQQNYYKGKRKDFYVKRGDTFDYDYKHKFVNASGVEGFYQFASADTGMMSIKKNKTDVVPIRRVRVTLSDNTATMFIGASQMDLDSGRYYYDFEIKDGSGAQITKLEGTFNVSQDVTEFIDTIEFKTLIAMANGVEYEHGQRFIADSQMVLSSEFFATLIEHMTIQPLLYFYSTLTHLRGIKWSTGIFMNSSFTYRGLISFWYPEVVIRTKWSFVFEGKPDGENA